ncbi:hypothetical protein N7533_002800 [Penicillium manginii]|uniref:uncharacterized protein n=1 Tax=Penicillium manginii TaxID=203109 RepID=UPI002546E342|nr:uncharacterized protein N7533_002800 [Penicillium manginii]KAJ5764119.1 hypothetical protein N7533_002800 [Penicillium manginii]
MTAIKPWRKHTTTSPQRSLALWANVSWLNGRSDTSSAVLRGRDSTGSTRGAQNENENYNTQDMRDARD